MHVDIISKIKHNNQTNKQTKLNPLVPSGVVILVNV
jgi:hypothetical protein